MAQIGLHAELARRPVSFLVEQLRQTLPTDLPPSDMHLFPAAYGKGVAVGQWVADQPSERRPLADRVEEEVAELLASRSHAPAEIAAAVYVRFPGWETPDAALVAACCASYGRLRDGQLHLREEDLPHQRTRDHDEMLQQLLDLAQRLGFVVWLAPWERAALQEGAQVGGVPDWAPASVVWHLDGEPAFAFALAHRAAVHPWLLPLREVLAGCPRYVILPGGRAELLDFKLRRCPEWRLRLAETGWEFVKHRHLRHLAAMTDLTLAGFRARIGMDPIVAMPGQQLSLFDDAGLGVNHAA